MSDYCDDEPGVIHVKPPSGKPSPIHYSGAICIVKGHSVCHTMKGGRACGDGHLGNRMSNTYDRERVTCKSCLKQIERHDFSARMHPEEKPWTP